MDIPRQQDKMLIYFPPLRCASVISSPTSASFHCASRPPSNVYPIMLASVGTIVVFSTAESSVLGLEDPEIVGNCIASRKYKIHWAMHILNHNDDATGC
jgi:hypothetical protein